jgi:hypothetical protein
MTSSASRVWTTSGRPVSRAARDGRGTPGLDVARAEVVVEVEAGLADADHARIGAQLHQCLFGEVGILLGLVRVGSDRAPDVGLVGDGADLVEVRGPGPRY